MRMENHRPISMLYSISKVLEIVLSNRTISFFNNRIVSESQHADQENKTSTTTTLDYVRKILEALDKGCLALGIFIGISKAFDCVNHYILLNIFERIGIRGHTYN